MTTYKITQSGEDYCIGCAHMLSHLNNIDVGDTWSLVCNNSSPEAYFLRIVQELIQIEVLDENTRFRFIDGEPVDLIDDEDIEEDDVEVEGRYSLVV